MFNKYFAAASLFLFAFGICSVILFIADKASLLQGILGAAACSVGYFVLEAGRIVSPQNPEGGEGSSDTAKSDS